ncbi:nonstructural protein [Blackfly microvirus SF02]|uniref:Nonstructural protein n=1 Tax=Blackfly microvirus SF02 TaxID=2576452 RepID=A0A4P8PK60_9VIRU|nr:nonstructural protein [Blackfly microvirus SF02]
MLLNAYTLYDNKALVYSPPFYASAHGQAVRLVMELAQDNNTTVGRHPSDFTLYCIGHFDDASGSLLPADVREHISDVLPLAPKRHADFVGQPDLTTNGSAK